MGQALSATAPAKLLLWLPANATGEYGVDRRLRQDFVFPRIAPKHSKRDPERENHARSLLRFSNVCRAVNHGM